MGGLTFDFDAYTDDTAPDYGAVVTAATIGVSLVFVGLMLATIAVMEEYTPLDGALPREPGVGLVVVAVVGYLASLVVGRYALVRGVDSGEKAKLAAGLATFLLVTGAGHAVLFETLADPGLFGYAAAFVLLAVVVAVTDAIVLGTGLDLSGWDELAIGALFVLGLIGLLLMGMAWDASSDGIFWSLFLLFRTVTFVVVPLLTVGLLHVHDVHRVADDDVPPGMNAAASFVAAFTLPLTLAATLGNVAWMLTLGEFDAETDSSAG
jgi:hypothetical protein